MQPFSCSTENSGEPVSRSSLVSTGSGALNRNDAEETTDGHGFTRMELSQVGDGSAKPGHRLVDALGPPESLVPSVSIGVHPWLNSFPSALIRLKLAGAILAL